MQKILKNNSIYDFIPPDASPTTVYWIDTSKDFDFWSFLWNEELYAVVVRPATKEFTINGKPNPAVKAFVGFTAFNKKVDYSAEENSVIEYSYKNGVNSDGDVLFLYKE
jgi:hypothetical protein